MLIIKDFTNLNGIEGEELFEKTIFQVESLPVTKESKINNFLNYIYSYPPKFKVKWDAMDELSTDLMLKKNYGVLEHSFPFIDFAHEFVFQSTTQDSIKVDYSKAELINGYQNKNHASTFYTKTTKDIQTALASVPVFVILNGYNEIVLSKPKKISTPQAEPSYLNQFAYNTCGAFDPLAEQRQQLGFFFMTYLDAQTYLQEVMKSDIDGTENVGLSIHCIGLDSAYRITREHHPEIDFRFVPNLKEVKRLLTKRIGPTDTIVDDNQQQLRFRRRTVNIIPQLGPIGRWVSPVNSFLHRNEYFKGVPIYVIQTTTKPRNIIFEPYFIAAGIFDSFWGRFLQYLDTGVGLGHNWIMQGSIKDAGSSDKFSNYIFFSKVDADKFLKKQGRKVARYSGSRTSNLEPLIRKPKLYIYNLEDFIELWEEKLQSDTILVNQPLQEGHTLEEKTLIGNKKTYFIPASNIVKDIKKRTVNTKRTVPSKIKQTLNLKYKNLKSFLGVFFGVGYL